MSPGISTDGDFERGVYQWKVECIHASMQRWIVTNSIYDYRLTFMPLENLW